MHPRPRLCSKPRRLPTLTALWGVGWMSFGSRGPRAPRVFWGAQHGSGWPHAGWSQPISFGRRLARLNRGRLSALGARLLNNTSAFTPSCRHAIAAPPKRNFCSRASAGFAPHVRYSREASILNTHCCGAAFHANLSGLAPCTVRAYLVPWVNLLRPAASEKEGFL